MAGNIKGITVEIGGNTAPLDKALKDVNKTSRDLQSELKQVQKALKLDPTNTTLLSQKQKLLAESITNTEDKLKTLKEAQKQVEQQFKDGKVGEEQYRALEREVAKTESELKNLQKQAGESNASLSKISNVTGSIGKSADAAGKSLLPVTAAVAAAGTAAVAAYNEVDAGADIVISKTGATGKAAKELETVYKDVASSTSASMDSVADAVGSVNTRFNFTGEQLKNASNDFLEFSRINKTDVNTSVQLVSRAMGDAGIKSNEYKSVLDKLTTASQKSGISIEDLTTNLAKYGAPMRALGVDTNHSIAMFAGWEKAGVNTEIAFSGMKKAISTWGAAGKDSTKEFSKALIEIKKCPDISSATTKAIQIFGQKAGPDLADAIKGGRFEVDQYVEALQKSGGTIDNTYKEIAGGNDQAKVAMNAGKVAASEFGGALLTMLSPVLKDIAAKAKELASKFSGLSDSTKKTILVIAGIIGVVAPILLIIGKIANGISLVTRAMAFMKTATMAQTIAQYGFNAALLANPITWIVVAIIAAITALVLIIKHLWDTNKSFRAEVISIWNAIKQTFTTVCNSIKQVALSVWKAIGPTIINGIKEVQKWWNSIWPELKQVFSMVWNGIKIVLAPIIAWLYVSIKTALGLIQGIWAPMWNGIKDVFSTIWNLIVDVVKIAWSYISGIIKAGLDVITGLFKIFKDIFTGNWSALWNDVKSLFSNIWNDISGIFKGVATGIENIFKDLIHGALSWGKDMIDGIVNGIKGAVGGLVDAVKGVANKIKNFLHFSVPDEGPLADYESWMPDFMEGLAKGINNSKHLVANAVKGLASDVNIGMKLTPAMAGIGPIRGMNSNQQAANNFSNNSKQPAILQFMMPSGKKIAEYFIDDMDQLQGKKTLLLARGQAKR